jgi:hypothetical protein
MPCPSLRTVPPSPCLPLDIKDSLKEDGGWLVGCLRGWVLLITLLADTADATGSCCCVSASLRIKTLREIKGNVGQCESKD